MNRNRASVVFVLLAPLAACKELGIGTSYREAKKQSIPDQGETAPIDITAKVKDARQLCVENVIVQVADGTEIGELRTAILQAQRRPIVWESNLAPKKGELIAATCARLKELGYRVEGHDTQLFGSMQASAEQMRLGAIVNRVLLSRDQVENSQTCTVAAEWQLFDPSTQQVVYVKAVTETLVQLDSRSPSVIKALVKGLDQVATDDRFIAALSRSDARSSSAPVGGDLMLEVDAESGPDASFVYEQEKLSTVVISTPTGAGSGVIITADGFILTAAHVVSDTENVTVELSAGIRLPAAVIRRNEADDVALLKATGVGFRAARLRLSSKAEPGSDVFVIGRPLSDKYAFSVTRGVVSGVRVDGGTERVQTDASVNSGNSGGPIFDGHGNVIAIVSWKRVDKHAEGIAFGVSIPQAIRGLRLRPVIRTK